VCRMMKEVLEYQTHLRIILIPFQITTYISWVLLHVFAMCLLGAYPHNTNTTVILSLVVLVNCPFYNKKFRKIEKMGGVYFTMKHKSGHKLSTRDFSDKLMLDLDSPPYLAPKNKVVSLNKFLHTPWQHVEEDISKI
jgi:hypothetical protein